MGKRTNLAACINMYWKELKSYYKTILAFLLTTFTIAIPFQGLVIAGNVFAGDIEPPIEDEITTTSMSANITAPGFSLPIDDGWPVSLDFGVLSDYGLCLGETVEVEKDTPVYAAGNGIVKFTGYTGTYEMTVIIEHFTGNETICSLYGHLDKDLQIEINQPVARGQIIGVTSDSEGNSREVPDFSFLYFALKKGVYNNINSFPAYDPPGDIIQWYDPSEFISLNTYPDDRTLVSPSDGPYENSIYWLQNQKLYHLVDKIDDSPSTTVLDEMSSMHGWDRDTIIKSSSFCLSLFEGWPYGTTEFISPESGSDGLLISVYESEDIYLIVNNGKLCFPDNTLSEYPEFDFNDVITVTERILGHFENVSDDAELLGEAGTIEVFPGQPFTLTVQMLNTGTSIWDNRLQYRLSVLSGIDSFPEIIQNIDINSENGCAVNPGDTCLFNTNEIVSPLLPGIYSIAFQMKRGPENIFGKIARFNIVVKPSNSCPEIPVKPSGPSSGTIGTAYTYHSCSFDMENDRIKYIIDWGDDIITESDFMDTNVQVEQSHIWHDPGTYQIRVKAIDASWNSTDWSVPLVVVIDAPVNNPPATSLPVSGPLSGYTDTLYMYTTSSTDMDGNRVKYVFDWNDDTTTETGYFDSGVTCSATHSWSNPGQYSIKVMTRDSQSAISYWSTGKTVTIYSRPSTPLTPEGPDTGFTNLSYEYTTTTSDRDSKEIKYIFDWGDNTITETDYIRPGTPVSLSHSWNSTGTYDIRVQAVTIDSSSAWSSPKQVMIIPIHSLDPPTPHLQFPADNGIVTGTSICFEWNMVTGATRYVLEVNSNESWNIDDRIYYVNVNSNTITLNDFPNNGTKYYWRVRAGNARVWSSWSTTNSFINIKQPSTPVIVGPESGDVIGIPVVTYSWDEVEGADRYLIEVNTQSSWNIQTRKLYKIIENATEYIDSGYELQNTTYYLRLRAGNESDWSAWSTTCMFTIASPLLVLPENGTQIAGGTILFDWLPVTNATEYQLEINTDPEWDPYTSKFNEIVGNMDIYEVSGFKEDGTVYYWRVKSSNGPELKTSSETWSFINTRAQAPSSPTITSPEDGTTVNGKTVTYKWEAKENASKYLLEINTDQEWNSRKWKLLKDVGNVTEYTDDGYLNDGTYYYWRVRAGNETGWSTPSEGFSFINFGLSAPFLIEPSDESILSNRSILVKWKAVANSEYYFLEVNSDESWNAKNRFFYKIVGKVTSQKLIDLPNDGTVYYWRVKASDGSHWSAWSEPHSFTSGLVGSVTAPTLTTPLDNSSIKGNTVTYSWSAVTHANQYWLEVNTDSVTWSRKTRKFFGNVGNVQTYKDSGYTNDGTIYYWRVRAGNNANWSTFSVVRSFTNW